jgi:hypothetical protein
MNWDIRKKYMQYLKSYKKNKIKIMHLLPQLLLLLLFFMLKKNKTEKQQKHAMRKNI